MTLEQVRTIIGWSTVINYAILFIWFGVFVSARGWLHRLHARCFPMSEERFAAMHYGLMGVFKLGILLFNLVPYVAMRFLA
jgi:Family of unknown function (DUF6868)